MQKHSEPHFKIGFGYDSHRFVAGRPLIVGGVIIPFNYGLEGHSDADVLLHAIADSLLGAAGLGDIGQHFPDTDPAYKDVKSTYLLAEVFKMIVTRGYRVGNIDAVVIAEKPKMAPHAPIMKKKIAKILLVSEHDISIKASTNEGMGFIGRGEGIAVVATALIYKDDGTITAAD
ncbi:MAG: 2-C-methyl-D-erythritol 2,4-cyclodiphosphate synthase [Candidatus Zixiibacteriota bacterium]|nr:MAG: 2-C-methyl-D-erythritol 2,4-cyclodiphosphate synthase [candidate division Zixibacteria bacterium]